MALVIAGQIVAMDRSDPAAMIQGRVWISDDGLIAAVTPDGGPSPLGFSAAPVVDVGNAYVLPGLIDLHNHLGYNTLPLWTEPKQKTPFLHHNSWTDAPTYKSAISWPAWILANADPEALLAYVQTRALVGGTTAIQGWPTANREHDQILRNVDSEKAGTSKDLVLTSALTKTPVDLAKVAQSISQGTGFIYHCAEGQPGTVVVREFTDAANAGCLRTTFIGIHCTSLAPSDWQRWPANQAGAVVWSPLSNLWLYGQTTHITSAIAQGVSMCLGSDWGPSGTKHVLGELKVAKLASDALGYGLTDQQLVAAITSNPGDALQRCWPRQVGRLTPGAFGDVVVVRSRNRGSVWSDVMAAREQEVALVVVGGVPRYGDVDLMTAAQATTAGPITVAGIKRQLAISQPSDGTKAWKWTDIVARLNAVRADPAGALDRAEARLHAFAGRITDEDAPLQLMLDMPSGGLLAFAGRPPHPDQVVIPPLPTLEHDAAFFASIHGRGFHGGLLDGLAGLYQ
jgi:cytosine/adenosine deaminase-related metal-dependent hydrolase